MTFGITVEEHLVMADSASTFYIAIDYNNKAHVKIVAINRDIIIHQLFPNQWILGVCVTIAQPKSGLDTNMLLNNV